MQVVVEGLLGHPNFAGRVVQRVSDHDITSVADDATIEPAPNGDCLDNLRDRALTDPLRLLGTVRLSYVRERLRLRLRLRLRQFVLDLWLTKFRNDSN